MDLIEINLELSDDYADCFTSKDPRQIVTLLELKTSRRITLSKTLLFLDEIQVTPQILASLRYFHELMPSLHIIAAGSLLEFVLEEHTFSMPVGRISEVDYVQAHRGMIFPVEVKAGKTGTLKYF